MIKLHLLNKKLIFISALFIFINLTFANEKKYPNKAITIVAPFPAGGSVDIMARLYGEELRKILNVPIVIENRAGAGGSVGSLHVAKSKPDGYTLVVSSGSSHLANPVIRGKTLGYDADKDFNHIALLGDSVSVLVVHKDVPVKSFAEFLKYAKATENKTTFSNAGIGAMSHLNVESLKSTFNLNNLNVPYKGGAQYIQAIVAHEVDFSIEGLVVYLPYIKSGILRPLAIASPSRLEELPNVPTFAELGYQNLNKNSWGMAISAPKDTPSEIVELLHKAIVKIAKTEKIKLALKQIATFPPENKKPSEINKIVKDYIENFKNKY